MIFQRIYTVNYLVTRLAPIFKFIAFMLLWIVLHGGLIILWYISAIVPMAELPPDSLSKRLILLMLSTIAIILAIVIANRWSRHWKPSLFRLGLTKTSVSNSFTKGVLLRSTLISLCFLAILTLGEIYITFDSPPYLPIIMYAGFFMIVSISEEVLARGYAFSYFQKHYGEIGAVLFSSIAFAALHLTNDHVGILAMLNLFLSGVLLSVCRLRYQNLWVPIGIHFSLYTLIIQTATHTR